MTKYSSEIAMSLQHVADLADTTGGEYQDMVNGAFSAVLHVMVIRHNQDLEKVKADIKSLADHFIERCDAIMRENLHPGRTLH